MQRRNANCRTEPGDSAWRPKAGERRARAGMRQLQIFRVGQRRLAPLLRISAHQIGAIWKEALPARTREGAIISHCDNKQAPGATIS
jgi:hypothetical protein